jgi:hypothetical protein
VLAIPAAHASFPVSSFGFPTMIQSTNSTVFNQALGTAWDLENANVSPFGSSTFGFPFVSTSGSQGKAIQATDFAQTTTISAFSYPGLTTGVNGFGDCSGLSGFSSFL